MRLLFCTNLPSPYRVDFFNELSKYCELSVCYERKSSVERDSKWINQSQRNYTEIFCEAQNIGVDKTIGLDIIKQVRRQKYDYLFISGYASPSVIFLITYCRFFRIPYFIETDGGFNKNDKFHVKFMKKILLGGAKGIFTTCQELIDYYKENGYNERIYKYPFSSFYKKDINVAPASIEEKIACRNYLGMCEKNIIITVGRFSYKEGYGKGYDRVLQAAQHLKQQNIGWYIIGGTPTETFVQMRDEMRLDNVHFVDFKKKDDLNIYYRAADIFVLMTIGDIWGLVINEAMACGLPVITTDRCVAGLEMISNGENGFIIPVGNDIALAEKVNLILQDEQLMTKIAKNNIKKVEYWTIENMVAKHLEVLSNM